MLIIGSIRFFTDGKLDANEGSTNEPPIPERKKPTGILLFMDKYAVYKAFIFDVSPISLTSLPSLRIQCSLPIQ
ncbi:MAG: hypothetical protein EBU27_07585 [Opitutae bacterium]|nr:hypothetical protein [Opitutae bacterium]